MAKCVGDLGAPQEALTIAAQSVDGIDALSEIRAVDDGLSAKTVVILLYQRASLLVSSITEKPRTSHCMCLGASGFFPFVPCRQGLPTVPRDRPAPPSQPMVLLGSALGAVLLVALLIGLFACRDGLGRRHHKYDQRVATSDESSEDDDSETEGGYAARRKRRERKTSRGKRPSSKNETGRRGRTSLWGYDGERDDEKLRLASHTEESRPLSGPPLPLTLVMEVLHLCRIEPHTLSRSRTQNMLAGKLQWECRIISSEAYRYSNHPLSPPQDDNQVQMKLSVDGIDTVEALLTEAFEYAALHPTLRSQLAPHPTSTVLNVTLQLPCAWTLQPSTCLQASDEW